MTREEAIKFASHAQSLTDLPEVKEFYALAESALREQEAKVVEIDQVKPLTLVDHCPNCGAKMDLEG